MKTLMLMICLLLTVTNVFADDIKCFSIPSNKYCGKGRVSYVTKDMDGACTCWQSTTVQTTGYNYCKGWGNMGDAGFRCSCNIEAACE